MRDLDKLNITDEVMASLSGIPDARFKRIMESLVRHLHDFARDVELTPDEWIAGIRFLTAVGQACTPARQEFILLSDTLGLSALVNLMNTGEGSASTQTSLLGPFFRENAPKFKLGDNIAVDVPGEVVSLSGRITDTEGKPVPHAHIDIWQTSSEGLYDIQEDPEVMNLRGQFICDAEGRYDIRTVIPLGYSIPVDGPVGEMVLGWGRHAHRPAHIHFLIGAPGYQELVTALYVAGDPNIESDVVYGVSRSLIVELQPAAKEGPAVGLRRITYDFRMARATGTGSKRVGADPAAVMPAAE